MYKRQILASADAKAPPVYFFSASKTIPDSRGDVDLDDDGEVDPRGDLRIDASGWLHRDGARLLSIGINTTLSWEQVNDRPSDGGTRRTRFLPLGIVSTADARVWVLQSRAGDSTWYTLYDVGATAVRTLVRSGSGAC